MGKQDHKGRFMKPPNTIEDPFKTFGDRFHMYPDNEIR